MIAVQRISVAALLILLVLTTGAWANKQCVKCGESIEGRYYLVGGNRAKCQECYRAQLPKCAKCGRPIIGKYYIKSDKTVLCETHYLSSLPRCAVCKEAVDGHYYTIKGVIYCREHAASVAPKCCVCGTSLLGQKALSFDSKRYFCEKCESRYPKCFVCGVPVAKNGMRLFDGRFECNKDANEAIFNEEQARVLYRQAVAEVEAVLGAVMKLDQRAISVHLVDQSALKREYGGNLREATRGFCQSTNRGGKWTHKIYVVNGLPKVPLISVFCHEYAHAWQNEKNRNNQSSTMRFKEGFAQWVSYKVAKSYGRTEEVKHMLSTRDSVYGGGLKDFVKLDELAGTRAVLQAARTNNKL